MMAEGEDAMAAKNITLSADERLIKAARERANREHTSLNSEFRRWLEQYAKKADEDARKRRVQEFNALVDQLSESIQINRKYTRDELNERR